MDKRSLYDIARKVRADDFFEYIYGVTSPLDEDIFNICKEYYEGEDGGGKKEMKSIQKDALTSRRGEMYFAAKNVSEVNDKYYNLLKKHGIVFENGDALGQLKKILRRDGVKLDRMNNAEKVASTKLNDTSIFKFEEALINLGMSLEITINKDLSLVEYLIYVKINKERASWQEER